MIVVRIHHGIGNQMFQYAFARAASLRQGVPFRMDLSWFDSPTRHRDYGLSRFNIVEAVASPEDVAAVLYRDRSRPGRRIRLLANKLRPRHRRNFVREDLSRFDPSLLDIGPSVYVFGYFGAEKYFRDAADTIRQEFTLNAPVSPANAELMKRMAVCESVCLSVRRGDFVGNALYDVCGLDYFRRAADAVAARVPSPQFFVFSDDNAWVRQHLDLPHPHTFVDHNYPDFYEDLRLMTHCRHYVMPNSTFSWWGAWLSRNPAAVVVAPRQWLNLDALKQPRYSAFVRDWCSTGTIDCSHALPEHWVRVPNP
jgi:hypothetical protein